MAYVSKINGYSVKDAEARELITTAQTAAEAAQQKANANETEITNIKNGTTTVAKAILAEKWTSTEGDVSIADTFTGLLQGINDNGAEISRLTTTVTANETAVQTAQNAAEAAQSTANTNASAITAIKDGTTIDSFADVETALAGKQASGDYATKTEAKGYADAKDAAITAANSAADAAQADVDALETKVTTLVGEDVDKSARTIASEEVAKIVANADASYDTLKEISDWISSHSESAAAMNTQINTNKTNIATNTTSIGQCQTALQNILDSDSIDSFADVAYQLMAVANGTVIVGKANDYNTSGGTINAKFTELSNSIAANSTAIDALEAGTISINYNAETEELTIA